MGPTGSARGRRSPAWTPARRPPDAAGHPPARARRRARVRRGPDRCRSARFPRGPDVVSGRSGGVRLTAPSSVTFGAPAGFARRVCAARVPCRCRPWSPRQSRRRLFRREEGGAERETGGQAAPRIRRASSRCSVGRYRKPAIPFTSSRLASFGRRVRLTAMVGTCASTGWRSHSSSGRVRAGRTRTARETGSPRARRAGPRPRPRRAPSGCRGSRRSAHSAR